MYKKQNRVQKDNREECIRRRTTFKRIWHSRIYQKQDKIQNDSKGQNAEEAGEDIKGWYRVER
jgi:hypothetical protein